MIQLLQPAVFKDQHHSHSIKHNKRANTPQPHTIDHVQFSKTTVPHALAKYIDHTKLTYNEDEAPIEAIKKLCTEAKDNGFYAVCVRPDKIDLAKSELKNSHVKVATVIGFPKSKVELSDEQTLATIGNFNLQDKLNETKQALKLGADELDLVLNVQQFKEEGSPGFHANTLLELASVKALARETPVKVIIEADLLSPDEIVQATKVCIEAGVDFVKTSTGMVNGGNGATPEDVTLIANTLKQFDTSGKIEIKASGGIKTSEDANALIKAGASRLGTSKGISLVLGSEGDKNDY